MLDSIDLGGSRTLDPTKVYLGNEHLRLGRYDDRDRYACLEGILVCESWGLMWECSCP
jgi:hypothetical protein